MRLFEHPDFDQAILQAADHFRGRGLRPAIIEKNYYATEVLRTFVAETGTTPGLLKTEKLRRLRPLAAQLVFEASHDPAKTLSLYPVLRSM